MARRSKQYVYNKNKLPGFIGNFEVKIAKNYRTVIPSEFRGLLQKDAIITKGFESTFIIIPKNNWEKLIKPIYNSSFLQRNIRDTTRYLIANSYLLEIDEQGRFVIPQSLRAHLAALNFEVPNTLIFAGMLDYIEIWEPNAWKNRQAMLSKSIDKIAESLENE